MKKHLFTIAILLISFTVKAQSWQWAGSAGTSGGTENATGVTTDASGNLYVAGNFTGASINFGGTILSNSGVSDLFLAKYDPWGNVLWAKKIGGAGNDKVNGIGIDFNGDIVITGVYSSNVLSFGTVFLTNTTAGFSDLFLARFDPSGTVLWAKKGGGNGDDVSNALSIDGSGNIFITGSYTSTAISFGTTTLLKSGTKDVLIAKFDLNGTILWAEHSSGASSVGEGTDISASTNGNIVLTGNFEGNNFGMGGNALTNAGYSDIFVSKYSNAGLTYWLRGGGGAGADQASGICTDAAGNIFITGNFYSAAATFGGTILTNNNVITNDIFIVKLDDTGNMSWAKSAGGTSSDAGKSIICDALDNIYISGYFGSSVAFGANTLISNGNSDIFIARYNAAGIAGYSKGAGGAGFDAAACIAIDPTNNAYLAGGFLSSTFTLGSYTLYNADLGDSISDMFITKLNHVNDIDNLELFQLTSIFPNPTCGQFTINVQQDATLIEILNAAGQIVQTKNITNAGNVRFEMRQPGVYVVRIYSSKQVTTQKLIVSN